MIIQSSNVNLSSQRRYERSQSSRITTTRWALGNPASATSNTITYSSKYATQDRYNNYNDFGQNYRQASKQLQHSLSQTVAEMKKVSSSDTESAQEKFSRLTLRSLFDLLLRPAREMRTEVSYGYSVSFSSFVPAESTIWNKATTTEYYMEEEESTTFSAKGNAITADGRTLDFNVNLSMSRSFCETYSEYNFSQYEQVLTDPLVIHLEDNPAAVSEQTFFFDIDSDGVDDELNMLGSGLGYLALDKNNDGKINNGSELFGTKSGNGFAELAQYDSDNNGWIDEADAIYSKLKVWIKDSDGNDKLLSLKEADVGAIYLGNTSTQFSLTDNHNNLNAMVRSTGMYFSESSGAARTIQQIDFARH